MSRVLSEWSFYILGLGIGLLFGYFILGAKPTQAADRPTSAQEFHQQAQACEAACRPYRFEYSLSGGCVCRSNGH